MTELDEHDIEDMLADDRWAATVVARELRGECPLCGERYCGMLRPSQSHYQPTNEHNKC